MSLFMDSSLRASFREVLEWEAQNPAIVAKDAIALRLRAQKANADLVRRAAAPIIRTSKTARKFIPHTEHCPHCKVEFWKIHHSSRYCSGTCQVAAGRLTEKAKALQQKSEAAK